MKVYIRASRNSEIFDTSTTGVPYYDSFLNPEELKYMQDTRNLTGEIVSGTPERYFRECAEMFNVSVDNLISQRQDGRDDEYADMIRNGVKFNLPYIFKEDGSQEGLHRMLAAAMVYGWDCNVCWLEVKPYDVDAYNEAKKAREANDYFRHEMKEAIFEAVAELEDWNSAPPADAEKQLANAIEKYAASMHNHIIDVDVEEKDYRGDASRYNVYLVTFDGYDLPTSSAHPDSPYVEDMYKLDGNEAEADDLDDIDALLDDLDISDMDDDEIESYFFK